MEISSKETIRAIAENAKDRRDFFDALIRLVADKTGAISGIAWDCSELPYRMICQIHTSSHEHVRLRVSEQSHLELLTRSLTASRSVLVKPSVDSSLSQPHENPVILIGVIKSPERRELVEVFLQNGLERKAYELAIEKFEALCVEAASFVNSSNPRFDPPARSDSQTTTGTVKKISPLKLNEYVHRIHRSLDPIETASQVANEGRRILDCDRLSIVQVKGRQFKITAISGQPSVNNRSNTVLLLRKLAKRILPTKQEFWYPSEAQTPTEIEKPLNDYLEIAATRSMVVFPVFDVPPNIDDQIDAQPDEGRLIGGLIIEECSGEWTRENVSQAVSVVARHGADAIRNSYNHRQVLFYPVWNWLGKSRAIFAARSLSKTLWIATAIGLLGLFLALYPAKLKIGCEGIIVPEHRSKVFVTVDGTVDEIKVSHGTTVRKGDLLVRLENLELETQSAELEGRIREVEQNIKTTETMLLSNVEDDRRLGEETLNAQKEELKSLVRQQELVQKKLGRLSILSPQDGQVVTWNIEDQYKQRPVSRGEQLMEVVNIDGPWQLQLNLSDRNAGHVLKAWNDGKGDLDVEFILAADPDKSFQGKVVSVGESTELSNDQEQVVPIEVRIEKSQLSIRQAKSGVFANIVCKDTTLGRSMFHGLSEFVQRQWFKLF